MRSNFHPEPFREPTILKCFQDLRITQNLFLTEKNREMFKIARDNIFEHRCGKCARTFRREPFRAPTCLKCFQDLSITPKLFLTENHLEISKNAHDNVFVHRRRKSARTFARSRVERRPT